MRVFQVTWSAFLALYDELFSLVGLSLLWWATGGIFAGAAVAIGWALFVTGAAWWIAPLAAIPAGPATAALAVAARRCARGASANRGHYFEGFKEYWRPALAISAISMAALALMCLNLVFYFFQANSFLRAFTFLWGYVILLGLGIQMHVYPALVSLERPTIWMAFRIALAAMLAHPVYSLLLLIIAGALTALCIVVPILIILIWPALTLLLGMQSLRFFLAGIGVKIDET